MNEENQFLLAEQRLYPHFKLTRERFPRLLATRKIADDGAEYFGAFLPETGVRFLIDFLNKTFRLRVCEIDVDGEFDVPCTQFYRKRCVAPCVKNLCDEAEYLERVALVRLFLQRKTGELEQYYLQKIETLAENFDYERAAETRDEWRGIEKIFAAKDWNFWLSDAVDNFEITENEEEIYIHLVTMRVRKTLGKRRFIFPKNTVGDDLLAQFLLQFYRFHAPKEIRVSHDFPHRSDVAYKLSLKFRRRIKIVVVREEQTKILTRRAIERAKYDYEFRQIKPEESLADIQSDLQKIFNLSSKPRRIEGYDVAHISATNFVAAKSVWKDGEIIGKEAEFWLANEKSELETMEKFIAKRFSRDEKDFPDLILIDGGKSHVNAALKGVKHLENRTFAIIGAVKRYREHDSIYKFLDEAHNLTKFLEKKTSHRILQIIRDEAHDLSNRIHRQRREFSHFYELAAVLPSLDEDERRKLLKKQGSLKNILEADEQSLTQIFSKEKSALIFRDRENYRAGNFTKIEPLIVPLRYTDENGDAADLRPLGNYRIK